MTTATPDRRRALVDLFPQFLRGRYRGWSGLAPLLASEGLAPPQFFLLRAVVEETDPGVGMSEVELRANLYNPYATIRTHLEQLPHLLQKGFVVEDAGRFTATTGGRALVRRVEAAARDYLATLTPAAAGDLDRLASTLVSTADRAWFAPEPAAKPHHARARRIWPDSHAPAMVRLNSAVYALWMARDDAHNAAWHRAGFEAPAFDLLTRVWTGQAATMDELVGALQQSQRPEDVAQGVTWLSAQGYATREDATLHLTDRGRSTRDAVEAETDRVYFAPWSSLSVEESEWLFTTLQAILASLPLGPPDRSVARI